MARDGDEPPCRRQRMDNVWEISDNVPSHEDEVLGLEVDQDEGIALDTIISSWRNKCELTAHMLACFKEFRRVNPGDEIRLKAKCKLCDDNSPYKFFHKGNNSNLKSHLSKVHPSHFKRIVAVSEEEKNEKVFERNDKSNPLSCSLIECAILNFLIKERLPISKSNSIHLTKLIDGTCQQASR
ncbi:uncharacterized protein LOC129571860 [Sitodiplosis mosellana]|uniref:uncharacterized protein LOC129571860 n=1 Tax=Sitodiplosis mosellana TaxID=263140 RepID=UPI0024448457|nr:uncharacterized protein LOC129571860 [Sitodiplosis mosellana]